MIAIHHSEITIAPNRQRREFDPDDLAKLTDSIARNGLLHPIVVRRTSPSTYTLVAGERRLRAIQDLWMTGAELRSGDKSFMEGFVPCNNLGDLDDIDAFEAELEENIRRTDLTWQEKAAATSQLYELRRLQAEKAGLPPPTSATLAAELAPEANTRGYDHNAQSAIREDLIVSKHLSDPDVLKAPSRKEAIKVLKRKEEAARMVELGEFVGKTHTSATHTLIQGDCLVEMAKLDPGSFDVILTDPPYGMNAQDFNDSGGKALGAHFYDDTYPNWLRLLSSFASDSYLLAKPQAHLYIFCDIDRFVELRDIVSAAGWEPFRTPIIWVNPQGMRAPWPEHGPQRKYQLCLYAIKGKRNVLSLQSDIITSGVDENLGHPAQKPIAVYENLFRRSVRPGDSVLDPFCGSGTVFPAAHGLKVRATGIELDPAAHGLAAKRLGELK